MREWYTPAQLADLKLPGFPNTPRGVSKWVARVRIHDEKPQLARKRSQSGGGYEYHFKALPPRPRSALVLRDLKTAEAPPMDEIFDGAHDIPEPVTNEAGELRRDAKLLILNFWDIFRVKSDMSLETARYTFVMMYRNGKISGIPAWVQRAMTTKAGKVKGLSVNTLRNWEYQRERGEFTDMAGRHGNRKGTGVLDTAEGGRVAKFIAARIVNQPHLTADHIRDLVAAEFGETLDAGGKARDLPPIRTFQHHISHWKAAHREALARMTDPDRYKSTIKFAGTNMNYWVKRPNQLWEIDASPADVLLTDGRHSIYAAVDIYTRRMMVTVTKTPRTAAVLGLVRVCIQAWGVPEIIRTDNGSDFTSHEFKRALTALGIHQDITDPYSPEQKGTIERHIGTLQRGLMPLLPGFVGHNVTDRKKIEARKSFAQRLGESDKDAFCVDLNQAELQDHAERWLELKYSHSKHAGLKGKTPFEMIAAWTGPIRHIENERALDVLLSPLAGKDGYRIVTKFGITLDKAHFIHGNLVPGTRVQVRIDPQDMGRVYVYSADGLEFICVAECPERLGKDPGDAVRAAREMQAERMRDEVDPLLRDIRAIKPRDAINSVLAVNERRHGNLAAFPKATEPHTSPELDAAHAAAQSDEPPAAAPLTTAQAAIQDKVVASLAAHRAAKPKSEMEEKRDRFARARRVETAMAAGAPVNPEEARWLGGYQATSEYRAQKRVMETTLAEQA